MLKLSGEALRGGHRAGIDTPTLTRIAGQIKRVVAMGVGVGIVVGGGNIWRGAKAEADGMERVTADYAGMLATVINALALQDVLESAIRHLEKGRVVIFAGGTGNPYMTADTAAALRAIEIGAEVLLMTKNNVDGIYTADPRKDPSAKKIDRITYIEVIRKRLAVMDTTALSLCMDNKLPIIVFDLEAKDGLVHAVMGKTIGTLVSSEI